MRTKKTVVILISGKAGSGKTTAKDILKQKIEETSLEVFPYSFANPLKYMAIAFFGWDKEKDDKGRKLLQDIGRIGREYDEHIWVKHFLNQLDKNNKSILPPSFVIIDDWRFPNELNYLKRSPLLDVVTIRIFGRGGLNGETASDVSENSLPEIDENTFVGEFLKTDDDHPYLFGIENNKDLESLEAKVDLLFSEIKRLYIVE